MRIAALALGILAGLLASLILALGGLDPSLFHGADPRYFAFGLSAIASLGIFGAALVLASPLAGAVLMLLAGVTWVGAAILLRHGPDAQLIGPPALFLVGTILAVIAFLRRDSRPLPVPRLELPSSAEAEPEPEPMTAGRMFDAEPSASAEPVPPLEPLPGFEAAEDLRASADGDWRPGKRRPPPPRQEPVFREPERDDDYEEESGFSRFARGVSGLLSFGLYAALAGAAALIYVNIRLDQPTHNTARQVAEVAPVSSSSAPSSASSSALAAPVLSSVSPPDESSIDEASVGDLALRQVGPGTIFAAPEQAASSASFEPVVAAASSAEPSSSAEASDISSEVPEQLIPDNLLDPLASSSSALDGGAASEPLSADAGPIIPFTMPAAMAAERAQPSPGPSSVASTPRQSDDTGL